MGFSAEEVKVSNTEGTSKYQQPGVSEKVMVTEVMLLKNEQWNTTSIQFRTVNENDQIGLSKRLSLKQEVSAGKSVSAWTVTAKNLLTMLMSIGLTREQADKVLNAKDEIELTKNLENALIGKPFRGLFASREYQPNKFATELYSTEPVGGTRLVYDPSNKNHLSKLDIAQADLPKQEIKKDDDLPF